jgi:hypothetical protein
MKAKCLTVDKNRTTVGAVDPRQHIHQVLFPAPLSPRKHVTSPFLNRYVHQSSLGALITPKVLDIFSMRIATFDCIKSPPEI